MIITSEVENDGATCEIMIDGFRMARDETDGTVGDSATRSATVEHPAVDDHAPTDGILT